MPICADRTEAGRRLAAVMVDAGYVAPVVLALPRGGIPVAIEIAEALNAPLDLLPVVKIGAPGDPELAVGAIVGGPAPQVVWNRPILRSLGLTPPALRDRLAAAQAELIRREALYLAGRAREAVAGRTAIVVDDGLATGTSARAALRALRARHPVRIVLAVPLAPVDTLEAIKAEADEVVCLARPVPFYGVGSHYGDFHQVEDREVAYLLADFTHAHASPRKASAE
ncbi:MAG: phosphoribosyltransferase [Azospirillum sp.]|nr:phosphoribosyltransferase [Azospirillum sp.]